MSRSRSLESRSNCRGAAGADHCAIDIEDHNGRPRRKFVAAFSEFQGSGDFLLSEDNAAGTVAVESERERVVLPAVFTLPHAVAGTAQARTRA